MGVFCLRALWMTKRKSESKLTTYLILHTICLELVNVIGLITNAISFTIVTVPAPNLPLSEQLACRSHSIAETNLNALTTISTVAFGLSGFLTDAILVSHRDFGTQPRMES